MDSIYTSVQLEMYTESIRFAYELYGILRNQVKFGEWLPMGKPLKLISSETSKWYC